MPTPARPRQRPSRRKIEYVPLAREVDTVGGRDMKIIEAETIATSLRRPLRDINDWGIVAVDALTMSIRSKLSTELSYALTTFTLLSTMRGDTPTSGFPIVQCADLLEEVLDLMEERAFDGAQDFAELEPSEDQHLTTHRELVNTLLELESQPFASLQPRQGAKDPDLGPRPRPGNIIITIVNIIRNLSFIPDNSGFLVQQERVFDLLLRMCSIVMKDGKPTAASPALSLGDLITVRKDTMLTLMHLAGAIHFSDPPSKTTIRIVNRTFRLLASYLVDSTEAISPYASMQNGHIKPPFLTDVALETFTRLAQSDPNRKVFSKAISEASLRLLFVSSVHRLPVGDPDFQVVARDRWLSYMEKIIMTLYSLAFIASPDLKKSIRADRRLGLKGVMLRMVQKFLTMPNHELKNLLSVPARRAVETMKLLDDCQDSFDTSEAAPATLSFGMGYGEVGDSGIEKGTGLLASNRDVAWGLLMLREVQQDEVMFSELDSLSRIE
ncbi:SWI/SNF chromatin-remodeling complex subunit sol1 [Mycena sanguinolenta]|uniref:SWI/SNF chromatin-remodeling complex subunit sol1 n=1 Tax=Mycena sanguinolenta TaxID=230812 RepID=A0A8H7CJC5_9AGAR|nr:SWI/SNF chromatin-remodeling complex subunit sol1 [Mycena sanguinolenta]